MRASVPSANDVLQALEAYHQAAQTKSLTESQVDAFFESAESFVPHANLSDLVFWGEKHRSDTEIVEEALYRERLWAEGGELAVLVREHELMASALQDASLDNRFRCYAEERLKIVIPAIHLLKNARPS